MSDLFPISLPEQIAEVAREVHVRERAYPRFVANKTLTQARAGRQMAALKAALETLKRLEGASP